MSRRSWRLKDELDALLFEHIAATRADPLLDEREDILAMMVGARDEARRRAERRAAARRADDADRGRARDDGDGDRMGRRAARAQPGRHGRGARGRRRVPGSARQGDPADPLADADHERTPHARAVRDRARGRSRATWRYWSTPTACTTTRASTPTRTRSAPSASSVSARQLLVRAVRRWRAPLPRGVARALRDEGRAARDARACGARRVGGDRARGAGRPHARATRRRARTRAREAEPRRRARRTRHAAAPTARA